MRLFRTLMLAVLLVAGLGTSVSAVAANKADGVHARPVVNINKASADELAEALNGVGTKKAQAIIRYRKQHGTFTSASQLSSVRGIGPATVKKNRDRIRVK